MKSCIYRGQIMHRRLKPRKHQFRYNLFMMYLDLDELPKLFKESWLWSSKKLAVVSFRRRYHLGDAKINLKEAVKQLVKKRINLEITGPIRLLTHLCYFGHVFNPASFYYCYDDKDENIVAIIVEITNTPWNERYCYVLDARENTTTDDTQQYTLQKCFHVSPFMDLDHTYNWRFSIPAEKLWIHMENMQNHNRYFSATLNLKKQPLTAKNLILHVLGFPFITIKVITAIYWQALKLYLKRIPFIPHPHNSLPLEKGQTSGRHRSAN